MMTRAVLHQFFLHSLTPPAQDLDLYRSPMNEVILLLLIQSAPEKEAISIGEEDGET